MRVRVRKARPRGSATRRGPRCDLLARTSVCSQDDPYARYTGELDTILHIVLLMVLHDTQPCADKSVPQRNAFHNWSCGLTCCCHLFLFLLQVIVAAMLSTFWPIDCKCAAGGSTPPMVRNTSTSFWLQASTNSHGFESHLASPLQAVELTELRTDESNHVFDRARLTMSNISARRRLVANDFNAEFSRRLSFHNWLEEDVVLDREGLERYLRRALTTAGLARRPGRASRALRNTLHTPQTVEALQRELAAAKFSFDSAYAAQAHHMLPGAPWSQGRDEFMHLIRLGLRPNHYFLGLGCGPFATGHHLVRYLLTARYFCIEQDEYLLRAALEYEVPAAGLIHKKPRFLLNDLAEVAAIVGPHSARSALCGRNPIDVRWCLSVICR